MAITLRGIVNAISTVGWAVVKIVLELTPLLRKLLPSLQTTWDEIDEMIRKGGIEADRFIHANQRTFEAVGVMGDQMVAVGKQLRKISDMTLEAAAPTDDGEDTLTITEAEAILSELGHLKDLLMLLSLSADASEPRLKLLAAAEAKRDVSLGGPAGTVA